MKSPFQLLCLILWASFCVGQTSSDVPVQQFIKEAEKYAAAKEYGKAADSYNKALAGGANPLQVYVKRAPLNFLAQRYGEAIADYTQLIELDPDKAGEYYYYRALSSLSVQSAFSTLCDDFNNAKQLGYPGDYKSFVSACPQLRKEK